MSNLLKADLFTQRSCKAGNFFDKILEPLIGGSLFAKAPDQKPAGRACPKEKGHMREIAIGRKDLEGF